MREQGSSSVEDLLATVTGLQSRLAVLERTAVELERARQALRQAQKMESIGLLAGGVAHDFNNLLTVINGYSEMLLRQMKERDPAREQVTEIWKAGERAASLTRQLLAFSRKQHLQPEVVSLNGLVRDVKKMLGRLIGEDIQLVVRLDENLSSVLVDPGQVEQVIVNLAVNARDAMPEGGELVIETRNMDMDASAAEAYSGMKPGPYVLLLMSDNGSGMDETTRARLFEPFFTTKEQGKGTGLGLAVVYGIIKQSNGFIYVESEPGKGTTFRIFLPRTARKPTDKREPETEQRARGGTETILLVEDEKEVRTLTSAALQSFGYRVLEAAAGDEAISVCTNYPGPIELLLTDVVMPRMSGHHLAETLVVSRPQLKVLFMSGYTEETIGRHGVAVGVVPFLHKPFVPIQLAHKVREVLDSAEG
jgi:signal transduction histidine kinase